MSQEKVFQHLFGTAWEAGPHTAMLQQMTKQYPWFAMAHYFLLKEQRQDDTPEQLLQQSKAPLFFQHPFQLHIALNDLHSSPEAKQLEGLTEAFQTLQQEDPNNDPAMGDPTAEPLFVKDYFASQGIQLSEQELTSDKVGKQLKSFTEWLKTMKKIPHGQAAIDPEKEDKAVEEMANKSNMETEILTETMAEILAQQGKREKAIEVYEKLRLQNPQKSAYFAEKLSKLN